MTGADIAFAVALIVAPMECPTPVIDEKEWPTVQAALWSVAIRWELMDPREVQFLLNRRDDFGIDLEIIRKRHRDLKGAPLIAEGEWLPSRELALQAKGFNYQFSENVQKRQQWETDRVDLYNAVLNETKHLYRVWDAVTDARCESFYITTRRNALRNLRNLIGPEAFAANKLPPYVPTWRYREIDP
jgi:hypothetical protein